MVRSGNCWKHENSRGSLPEESAPIIAMKGERKCSTELTGTYAKKFGFAGT